MISRDESQQKFITLWIANNYMGGLAAITAYGKTRTAIKCALQSKSESVNVIVPTKELKTQWESSLTNWKVPNFTVYVVNTAAKLSLNCDLIIIDEAHTSGMADWFQLSWQKAKFNKLIWLSATPERRDNKHLKLFSIAPKLMAVTFQEALRNKWIANYDMFNVGIHLTTAEQILYDRIQLDLEEIYSDIDDIEAIGIDLVKTEAFKIAREYLKSKDWGKIKIGKKYYKLIGERRFLLYNAENKLIRTYNYIINNPEKKILVFSQSQEFADKLQELLGDICVTIHSGLSDKVRELNLKKFRDNKTKVRVISSIKALNEGIDLPELEVGICASGTSSKKDMVQMLGRICRLNNDKHALFFNVYCKKTQDVYWLRNRQWDMDTTKIKWLQ